MAKLKRTAKKIFRKVGTAAGEAYGAVSGVVGETYDKVMDKRLCIGVTGLSRSGKTTFITSLIHQLAHFDNANLSGFSPVISDRLLDIKIHDLNDADLALFPYQQSFLSLCEPHSSWPSSTKDVSGCTIELRLKSAKTLNPLQRDYFSLFVEIRDYPGEWLLDLPLRSMSFAHWSTQCQALYQRQPRRDFLGPLYDELMSIDPLAECDEQYLDVLHGQFVKFLQQCKQEKGGLSLIQPGQFLLPSNANTPLAFVPLISASSYRDEDLQKARENSYFKICQARYQQYVKELVEPFYKHFFSKVDRQVVLVDLISALNGGEPYLDDMREAMSRIMESFSYGEQNFIMQLLNPKIDKLVFVASKMDQILAKEHESIRQLLSAVVKESYRQASHVGVEPLIEAVSAVRAAVEDRHHGEDTLCGVDSAGNRVGYRHPEMPSKMPDSSFWQALDNWKIPLLKPPAGINQHSNLPHIRMDIVLNHLIGDKCR